MALASLTVEKPPKLVIARSVSDEAIPSFGAGDCLARSDRRIVFTLTGHWVRFHLEELTG